MIESCKEFDVINIKDHQHWLYERTKGIGGSDAGIILNQSKYKTRFELWEEKTGRRKVPFITNESIELGNTLEPVLIDLFGKTHKEYQVIDTKEISLVSKKYCYLRANLDGALINQEGLKGVLEIKTTTIQNKSMMEEWKGQVPQTYYCQILHYLNVTGFDYAILFAWINFPYWGKAELKEYFFSAHDPQIQEDMKYLLKEEKRFWKEVQNGVSTEFINKKIMI